MKTPSGEPMPDWWWFLGPPARRATTEDRRVPVSAAHKSPDKGRCMVCGQLYSEHTPQEQASGCKR